MRGNSQRSGCCDMRALTSNKEEQHHAKLIALIGEWIAEEISEVLVVAANSK